MALDGITVACITRELYEKLKDARISRIAQPENDELLFTLKGRERGQLRLLMSASASLPLIYLTDKNLMSPVTAPNFCMLLRKYIGNGKIIRVYQPSLERIIRFEIEHYDEMGDLKHSTLILELMGKYSNIIFCSEDGTIIDSIKHIGANTSSVREVFPGRPYFIPDTQHKANPLTADSQSFIQQVFTKAMPLSKAIYSSYTGLSPVAAEELCFRASLESSQPASSVEPLAQVHLANLFLLMMEDVKEGKFTPNIVTDEKNEPVEFAALPLTMYSDMKCTAYPSISVVLQQYYDLRNKVNRIRQKSADLRHITSTALERTARKLQLQDKQLKDTRKRDKYRLYGELLHTYGFHVPEGASSVTVTNYYTNEDITIPLDPQKTAAENAQHFYDKYDKMKRTYEALTELTKETQAELEQLESIQTFLDMADGEEDLVQVKQELQDSGFIKAHYGSDKKGSGKAGRRENVKKQRIVSRPYHYRTPDGYDVYVGKNNYQNDELTFHFASGNDLWFHAKGCPGSHVILKYKGVPVPDSAYEDAARLAAYYSANRASGKVEVDYVRKKEVKKPSKARSGFVVYYTNYSMVIEPDIRRMELVE